MKKGIDTLKNEAIGDTQNGEGCFNENGCDHEWSRIEPETNPKMLALGLTTSCRLLSKCVHKYCDYYKWVIDRANHYAERTGISVDKVLEIFEMNRTYSWINYYQEASFPEKGRKADVDYIVRAHDNLRKIESMVGTYKEILDLLGLDSDADVCQEIQTRLCALEKEGSKLRASLSLMELFSLVHSSYQMER